jgi:ABC-type polysaccharide/polyol phosphate export permease
VSVTKRAATTTHPAGRWAGPSAVREVFASRELLGNLTLRELRSKYRGTALGQGWSLLHPIALLSIYSVVFSSILRVKPPTGSPSGLDSFVLWLATALLPFLFFSTIVTAGMGALVGNANLIKKVYFPRETLVLSTALACLVSFLIEYAVLHVAVVFFGGSLSPIRGLMTLLLVVMLFLFALGLALMASVVNVIFRDTQHLLTLVMQAWLYATPVIYPITLVRSQLDEDSVAYRIYSLNPMAGFAESFRDTVYDGRMPDALTLGYLGLVTALVLVGGHVLFRLLEGSLAEEL